MKVITFLVPFSSSSDQNFPASNLAALNTQPLGWVSSRFCTYPQELLIQFQNQMNIKKVQLLSHEKKISSKIEVYVGRNWKQQRNQQPLSQNDITVMGQDGIKFQRIGYFTFSPNDASNWSSRELKTVSIDQIDCNYIRLVLNKNHDNRYNLFGQVGVVAIRVYGEVQELTPPSVQRQRNVDYKPMSTQQEEAQREETYIDSQTMQQIYGLQYQKDFAVKSEDFETAKSFKLQIDALKILGRQIKELEDKKQSSIQNEDYDNAQIYKKQVLEQRIKAGQIDQNGNDVKLNINYIRQDPQPQQYEPNDRKSLQEQKIIQEYQQEPSDHQQDHNPSQQQESRQYDNILQEEDEYDGQEDYDQEFQPLEEKTQSKQKYISHDDMVIPTIANKNKLEEEAKLEKENQDQSVQEVEGLTINNEKLAEPLIPYFTLDFCKKLFSKQWMLREEAFHWLSKELEKPTQIKTDPKETLFQMGLQVVQIGLNDKIEKIIIAALTTLKSLLQNVDLKQEQSLKGEIPIYLDNILLVLMEKIGDNNARVKDEAEKIIYSMVDCPSVGITPIINQLIRGITTKPRLQQSSRHTHARLVIIYNLIKRQKIINKTPYNPIIEFAIRNLDNPAENVRSAAIYIIAELYRNLKGVVRLNLGNVRPAIMQVLEEVFIKIDNGQSIEGTIDPDKTRKLAVEQKLQGQKPNQLPNEQQQMKMLDNKVQTSCEFCGQTDKEFGQNNKLDLHLWRECPMLTTCMSCAQVVEIQTLSSHHLEECEQLNNFQKCTRCDVAVLTKDLQKHLQDQVCKNNKGSICPLCFESLTEWRVHLPICTKNDRNKIK